MRLTKYVHSCLLVETLEATVLFDPGKFSWDSQLLDIGRLPKLDYIVITHEHSDHYELEFVKALAQKFPGIPIITNPELAPKISASGISNSLITDNKDGFEIFKAPHEPLPLDMPVVSNIGVHFNRLTHPGDAFDFSETREILALPLTAPWGSVTQALDAAVRLKPKIVMPVHDWHWHELARQQMYGMSQSLLEPKGIKFIVPENGQPTEL